MESLHKKTTTVDTTTVLSETWIFNENGNTKLKRKRKHTNTITKDDKMVEWLSFCCQTWRVKINRETKARLLLRLQDTDPRIIENELKKKNDGQE